MTRRQLLVARILLVVYIIAVLVLCFGQFKSTEEIPRSFLGIPMDKVVHFLMFFPFPFLVFFSFGKRGDKAWKAILKTLLVFSLGCILAGVTEIVQGELGYRSADILDFRADGLSLAIASLTTFLFRIL